MDTGHAGMLLEHFWKCKPAQIAKLEKAEVAALRYYTSSSFKLINWPLRTGDSNVPLPIITVLISRALKKMRANNMVHTGKFKKRFLWRGLKDRYADETFFVTGGTEMACMSTSSDLKVVAGYACSQTPLLFRIVIESPMDMGAEIKWLSMFPGEEEVLYPPLTYLKPLFKQQIKDWS